MAQAPGPAAPEGRQLTYPNLNELCQRFGAHEALAAVAREQGDVVHFLAGRSAGWEGVAASLSLAGEE